MRDGPVDRVAEHRDPQVVREELLGDPRTQVRRHEDEAGAALRRHVDQEARIDPLPEASLLGDEARVAAVEREVGVEGVGHRGTARLHDVHVVHGPVPHRRHRTRGGWVDDDLNRRGRPAVRPGLD